MVLFKLGSLSRYQRSLMDANQICQGTFLVVLAFLIVCGTGKQSLGQAISFRNDTKTFVRIDVTGYQLPGSQKQSATASIRVSPNDTGKISYGSLDGTPETVWFDIKNSFGSNSFSARIKNSNPVISIEPSDLIIVENQPRFLTWNISKTVKIKAKFVGFNSESDHSRIVLLQETGQLQVVQTSALPELEQRMVESIASGRHRFTWNIGGKNLRTEQLVGKSVVVVVKSYEKADQLDAKGQTQFDIKYGPIVEGVVSKTEPHALYVSGKVTSYQAGFFGTKKTEKNVKDEKISFREKLKIETYYGYRKVSEKYTQFPKVDSIAIQDWIYQPKGGSQLSKAESTTFWKAIAAGDESIFFTPSEIKKVENARGAAKGAALMGAAIVGLKILESKLEADDREIRVGDRVEENAFASSWRGVCVAISQGRYDVRIDSTERTNYKRGSTYNFRRAELRKIN